MIKRKNSYFRAEADQIDQILKIEHIAASNDLIFCLSTSQKIHVLDIQDLEEVYIIDVYEENASFQTLSISNEQLILRNDGFAEIRNFQGDQKLRINCSKNTFVFLFDPEIVVLLEEIDFSVSITLRHKKQILQYMVM